MGAIHFSIDVSLAGLLARELGISIFVETGTFKGDSVALVRSMFSEIHTCEFSPELHQSALRRFEADKAVTCHLGDSAILLQEIASRLEGRPAFYFLDAHWCEAENTAGKNSQCPLLNELSAIDALNNRSVIVIDDARLFLAPPPAPHETSQWPSFHELVCQLFSMSGDHELMVVNDNIIFFPRSAKAVIDAYAKTHGVDWLVAANCLKEDGNFMKQLSEKEAVIQEKEAVIQEKEAVIQVQNKALNAYKIFYKIPCAGFLKRAIDAFMPRLGNLNQYAPRQLNFKNKATPHSETPANISISIVTPSYQQGKFIEKTINSVLAQNYMPLEYIVQDGGSTDETIAILKNYEPRLAACASAKDSGQAEAINNGFSKSTGEIMAWLNSDDLLLPGALVKVASFFDSHPAVDVVYGNRLLIDENDMEIGRWILPGHDSDILSWVDYVPQETLFWRRRVWEKIGGKVDESFRFAMDWDLLLRFRDVGAKFEHIPEFLGAFRIHSSQKTSANLNDVGHHEMDRIRHKLHGRVPSRVEIRKAQMRYLVKHIFCDLVYRMRCYFSIK
jgi:glycosyltransferase involved in cell wall biosynthesis